MISKSLYANQGDLSTKESVIIQSQTYVIMLDTSLSNSSFPQINVGCSWFRDKSVIGISLESESIVLIKLTSIGGSLASFMYCSRFYIVD